MLLLPTILAPLLATAAWAQSNSTAANRTKIPFPYNGTFNTDNATFIYPKSGDYWSFPYSKDWPVIYSRPKDSVEPWVIYLQNVNVPNFFYQWVRYNDSYLQPNLMSPITNKDWPKDQTWCQYQNWQPSMLAGKPGTGYFLSIYLGNRTASPWGDIPAYGHPLAVSEFFEIRNTTTIDPNLPKGPNKYASPTHSYSGAGQNRPSSALLTGIGAVACVAAICAL